MLVINRLHRSARRDDTGAVLVTVVVVMLVGFIVASIIAASVLFTIRANVTNKGQTQAFIAAESGRDVAVASMATCSTTHFTGTDPTYDTRVYFSNVDGVQPTTSNGLTEGCPTSATDYVVIKSTGTGPDNSTITIDSVFPWQVTYTQQPGGVVTYFSGGFTAGVSHYTGDLVLRDGTYRCNNSATLTGDLYVLSGDVEFSTTCRVEGDIWANGHVTNGSQASTITGSITTNSYVTLSSNGATSVGKDINAVGEVHLDNQGNDLATVGGNITSATGINVESNWTVNGTGTPNQQTIAGFTPTFDPTLAWLKAATKWIDLSNASNWGSSYVGACDLLKKNNPPTTIAALLATAGPKLVLDFTSCTAKNGNGQEAVEIELTNVDLARDAVIIVKPAAIMKVNLNGDLDAGASTKQLLFIHSDGSTAYVNGEPAPTCGNGSQKDSFDVSGTQTGDVRIMVYSPCGLTGTVTSSFSGQLYTNDSTNLHSAGPINTAYTCKDMSWSPAFDQLGCKIKGTGGINQGSLVQRLGQLVYQTER
jgi:cytoskeletal protein CcmA (bactofilin family)